MFIGHYGPAVYDVLRSGKVKLWQAFLAVQAMDIVFCLFALAGLEGAASVIDGDLVFNIPWSHSFVSAIVIAFIAASIYRLIYRGDRGSTRGYWTIWLLAFSHWPLDWLVHRPDLPFYPGGELMMGLSLWDFAWPTYGLEVLLLGGAIAFWLVKTTGPRWTAIGAWLLVALLCVVQFFSITKTTLDQQAGTLDVSALPSGVPFAISGLIFYFFVASVVGWLESKRTYS